MGDGAQAVPEDEAGQAAAGETYHLHASSLSSRRRTHVLAHGDTFAVLDQSGDVPFVVEEEAGLFFRGTRHCSQLELLVGGPPPFFLSGAVTHDGLAAVANLANNDFALDGVAVPHSTIAVRRTTQLCRVQLIVRLAFHNFNTTRLRLPIVLLLAADFRDVFEVRGMQRPRRGMAFAPRIDGDALVLGYRGLDGIMRTTRCRVEGATPTWEGRTGRVTLDLAPQDERAIDVILECATDDVTCTPCGDARTSEDIREREHRQWLAERSAFQAPDEELTGFLARALADIFMLTAPTEPGTSHAVDRCVYAGIPWFFTIFGRDAIITARELLTVAPGLARGVLRVLAALQGTRREPVADEAPGKIIHEMRYGEMAATGEVPFGRYYGSVDATPLYCMLLADYARVTGDRALVSQLWPNALAAIGWMECDGDRDGDGYLEYERATEHGLRNQGWKDSSDAIFHQDGSLAEAPIALVEVQGYRYAALVAMAGLADEMETPDSREQAARWRAQAATLQNRINADFWLEADDTYALALDRDKRPCAVATSNAGHLLWCGVPDAARAERLAARLLRNDFFSGWGIRTVASGQPRYNPMSYHNGSVWPHDNALIAAGLRRYAHVGGVLQVLGSLVEAALAFEDRRLPELFCGFGRRRGTAPVPYPVACRPQAWAAGSVFLLLEAALGLEIHGGDRRIVFRQPQLPPWLAWLEIRNLAVGSARIDLSILRGRYGGSVEILRKEGEVEVVETR
jgi:glycogen debranching enzyme